MTIDLKQLAERKNTSGILTADRYVSAFVGCYEGADGSLCPAKLFEMSGDEFAKMVKSAESRLTYAEIEPQVIKIADSDLMTKAREMVGDERASIVEKALAVFENVMSVSGEDRDGDWMHTKGMVVDDNMPLLWMHMQVNPIGAFLGKTLHDDKILKGLHAVAATKLGQDVVTLVELGGLRTSIGFNPHAGAVTPRKTTNVAGKKKVLSWEVKGCDVLEDSVVSVPACKDAVITAFSRSKLHDDYVKHWAKSISDGRPLIFAGIDFDANGLVTKHTVVESTMAVLAGKSKDAMKDAAKPDDCCKGKPEGEMCDDCKKKPKKKPGDAENTNSGDTDDNADPNEKLFERLTAKGFKFTVEQAKGFSAEQTALLLSDRVSIVPATETEPATLIVKSVEGGLSHKMYGMNDHVLPGSFEWVGYKLNRAAKSFLVGQGVMGEDDYGAGVVATFSSEVILCCGPYEKKSCFRASYSIDDSGMPRFTGDAVEVEIKAQVVEKWFNLMQKRLDLFTPETVEQTAVELATKLCALVVDSEDETLGEAIKMASHAAAVYHDHDEATLYGELLTAN